MKKVISIIAIYLIVAIIPFFFNFNSYSKVEQIEELIQELEGKTPNILRKYDIPGATISVINEGEVKWIGAFGYQDLENSIKMSDQAVFQAASISKPVTALGIMKLVDGGYISLDDPVSEHITRWDIPNSEFDSDKVTIRSLLSHTSGLSLGGGYPGYEPDQKLPTLEDSLSGIGGGARPVELIRNPGEIFIYSGGGYNLLQLLIEEVTGRSFAEYMEEDVLLPLNMTNSSFYWEESLRPQIAKAYDQQMNLLPNYLFIEQAAAGLYTTIHDMNSFVLYSINHYFANRELYTPQMEVGGLTGIIYENTALGHFININEDGSQIVAHDGANNGWRAKFAFVPDKGEGIVILTNGNNGTYLWNEVMDAWYFSIFNTKRPFNKLTSNGSAFIYSISFLIVLWSILAASEVIKGTKAGSRKIISLSLRWGLVMKTISFILMILLLYIVKVMVVPILSFVNPKLGNVLFIAINIRVMVGVMQLLLPKIKEPKAI